jgi:hypothetical protein
VDTDYECIAFFLNSIEEDALALAEQAEERSLEGTGTEVYLLLVGFSEYHTGTRNRVVQLDDTLHG